MQPSTMKLRTSLLVGCMLVVPAWAMFSHTMPKELRKKLRNLVSLTQPVAAAAPSTGTAPPAAPPAGRSVAPVAPVAGTGSTAPNAAVSPPATGLRAVAGTVEPQPSRGQPTVNAVAQQPPAIVSQLADRTRQVRDQQARELQSIEAQLTAIGALGFDCQLLAGGEGLHGCSCRVPVDASGQLQRVFQAAGHDPLSAATALRDQVTAWKERSAGIAGPIR